MKPGITTAGKTIYAYVPPKLTMAIKAIPGATYDKHLGLYTFPAGSPTAVAALADFAKSSGVKPVELPTFSGGKYVQPDTVFPAWKHQQTAIDFATPLPGALLDMDMGTGKTKVAIDLIQGRGHGKVLIMCPLNAVSVWEYQFSVHTKHKLDVRTFSGKDTIATRVRGYDGAQVCIANYDMIRSDAFCNWAYRQGFDLVICDESHRIKDPTGVTSQWLGRVGWKTDYRLALTGTPAPNGIQDTFAQFRFIDPGIFGTVYSKFCKEYTTGQLRPHIKITGYKNLEDYRARYRTVTYSITAEDAGLELPDFMHDWRYCELEPAARKVYNDLKTEFIAEIESHTIAVQNVLTKCIRLHQITSGYVPDDRGQLLQVSTVKANLFRDMMLDMPPEPIVIFYVYVKDAEAIAAGCKGRNVYFLNGQHKQSNDWKKDDKGVLAVQMQSGSSAEDFTHARIGVYYSVNHKNGDYRQSLARLRRPGADKPGLYLHTVVKGTIDEYIYKNNDRKQTFVEMILNGGYNEI